MNDEVRGDEVWDDDNLSFIGVLFVLYRRTQPFEISYYM